MHYYNNSKNTVKIVIVIVVLALVWALLKPVLVEKQRSVSGIPDPVQTATTGSEQLKKAGYDVTITFLYDYDIEALVVSKKKYSGFSLADKLSPMDVALAWGSVAQYNTQCKIKWSQSGRWYFWKCKESPAFEDVGGSYGITLRSSNNHLIPCDLEIKNKLKKIKIGDHIRIKGYLVNVEAAKGDDTFYWYSSTSRDDEGDGACEVIYVKEIEWL